MTTLFIGNLSPEVTEEDLRVLFQVHGKINSLRLLSRRGMAFVELSQDAAEAALEALRGVQLKGRTLDVALERSRGRQGRRPGRGSRR